jgi:hypothetical protein
MQRRFQLLPLHGRGHTEVFHRLRDLRSARLQELAIDRVDLGAFDLNSDAEGFFHAERARAAAEIGQ